MRAKHGNAHSFRLWVGAAALAFVSLNAAARAPADYRGFSTSAATSGTKQVFTPGQPTASPAWSWGPSSQVPTGNAIGGGAMGFAPGNGTSGPILRSKTQFPIPGQPGKYHPLETMAGVPKPMAGAAIARFAAKVAFPLSIGMAVYDLMADLGVSWHQGDPANGVDNTFDETKFTGTWKASSAYFSNVTAEGPASAGCEAARLAWSNVNPVNWKNWVVEAIGAPDGAGQVICYLRYQSAPFWNNTSMQQTIVPGPPKETHTPITEAQLAERIASVSNWTTDEARALADAVNAKLGDDTIVYEAPKFESISPQTFEGNVIKSVASTPDGGTVTTTTTTGVELKTSPDGKLEVTEKTTTTKVTQNPDGTTITEGQVEEKPAEEKTDPCADNADLVGCKALGEPPAEEVPKSTKPLEFTVQDLGWGSGACPANPTWSDRLGSHVVDLGPYCDMIRNVVKPLVLAFAALMALAIVAPGFRLGED